MDNSRNQSQLWNYAWPMTSWFRWLRGRWGDDDRRALAETMAAVMLVHGGYDDSASRLLGSSPVSNHLHLLATVYAGAAVVLCDANHGEGKLLAIVRANSERDARWVDTGTSGGDVRRTAVREFHALVGALASSAHGGPDADTGPLMNVVRDIIHDTGTPYSAHLTAGLLTLGSTWKIAPQPLAAALAELRDPDVGGAA